MPVFNQSFSAYLRDDAFFIFSGFVEVGKDGATDAFGSLYEALTHKFFAAQSEANTVSNSTCNIPPDYALNIMRPATLTTDLPWTGVVFGITISSVWYWCADQVCLLYVL